jgi:hypothetical protein
MAFSKDAKIKFRQSTAADLVGNRVRIRPANTPAVKDEPFDDVALADVEVTPDGFSHIPFAALAHGQELDGRYDVHVTALDDAGNESEGFLEIDNQDFDFVLPSAPTDGSIV